MTIKLPRKATGFAFIVVAILVAGLAVKAASIGAVCLALAGAYATFVGGHQHAETLVARAASEDKAIEAAKEDAVPGE